MAKKKAFGRLAKYVHPLEAMVAFRRHYSIPNDVGLEYRHWEDVLPSWLGDRVIPVAAIIEGGVRFLLDPLLVEFLNFFNLSPTQVSPNIFRIVMGGGGAKSPIRPVTDCAWYSGHIHFV